MIEEIKYRRSIAALALVLLALLSAVSPLKDKITESALDTIEFSVKFCNGIPYYDKIVKEVGLYRHGRLTKVTARLIEGSGARRVKDIFMIRLDDVNAYAVFDGHIIVHEGTLRVLENDDELACVIAHEMAHIELRHLTRAEIGAIFHGLLHGLSPLEIENIHINSKMYEMEADLTEMQYVRSAGYDPTACVNLMRKLDTLEKSNDVRVTMFARHPRTDVRINYMMDSLHK